MPHSRAYKRSVNYEESKVPQYELPDPLVFNDGKAVKNHRQWTKKRRAEILEIFSQEMYGHIPSRPEGMHYSTISEEVVYDGLGLRKVVRIFLDSSDAHWFDVLIHIPANANGPVPMFVGLNFKGNDATLDELMKMRKYAVYHKENVRKKTVSLNLFFSDFHFNIAKSNHRQNLFFYIMATEQSSKANL